MSNNSSMLRHGSIFGAGHIWKVICQLLKIVYREVEKNSSKRKQMNGTIIQKVSAFLKLQKLQGNIFSFPEMFYRIRLVGSYERILLKAFQFVSIVYFTETEISSRKHQAGTMSVIRFKMNADYQQLELDLNFSIQIL